MLKNLREGDTFPDFELPDENGVTHKLSDIQGANPLVVQLARLTGAPIRGVRVVRAPDGNHFRGELTDEIAAVRDAEGNIDIQATTEAITNVIEGWVREHLEQWLWLHRRCR